MTVTLENHVQLNKCAVFPHVKVGYRTYANETMIRSHTTIGRYCSIGRRCTINAAIHPKSWLSTHPFFTSADQNPSAEPYPEGEKKLVIGNDVWIGDNVVIMGGITIGDGAIVGAGAVVTRNVEPYSIVGGVPARKIKMRFDAHIVEKFLALRWWEYDEGFLVSLPHQDVETVIDTIESQLASPFPPQLLPPHHRGA